MKDEGTGSGKMLLSASAALVLCLLANLLLLPVIDAQGSTDSDGDGLPDQWERQYGFNETDPSDASEDPDSDGLSNLDEYDNGTHPKNNDTDTDGMDDGWELTYGLDPLDPSDASGDADSDGLPNLREYEIRSDPTDYYDPGTAPVDDDDDTADDDDGPAMDGDMGESAKSALIPCGLLFFILGVIIVIGLVIGIYSKIRRDRLLDHETRQRIVDFLKENPGTYYSQMRRDLDLAHGVLTHHLNMLEQQELIFSKQDRSYRRFYLDGMYRKGPLVTGSQKKVMDAVRRNPGSSQSEIGRKIGMGRMIVSYHINALEDLGLLEKRKHGRENLVFPVNGDEKEKSPGQDLMDEKMRGLTEVEA